MLLLLWPGARAAILRRASSGNIGARIVGGHYSRGRWRTRQEEKARLAREAAERRRKRRERERKERERVAAFEAALVAREQQHARELARINSWAQLYDGVSVDNSAIGQSIALANVLARNSRMMTSEKEERELLEALFSA